MLTRTIVGLIFAVIYMSLLVVLPPVWLAVTLAGVVALAAYEVLRATREVRHTVLYIVTSAAAALIPLGYHFGMGEMAVRCAVLLVLVAVFFTAVRYYDCGEQTVPYDQVMVCLFSGVLVPWCLTALIQLRGMEHGAYLVLLPVISASLTDVGAYFIGMLFGKHRGVTRVSPNKSIEGYLGGIFVGCLIMMLYALVLSRFGGVEVSFLRMALYGLVGSAVTELGDLSFSLIKRQCGVKDYGDLMPGHGGMMDRFDSTVFAAPTILLFVQLLPAF